MAFPLTYTASYNLTDYIGQQLSMDCSYVQRNIEAIFSANTVPAQPENKKKEAYTFKSEFLGFEFDATFRCRQTDDELEFSYTADLVNLFKILIAILLASAFMASFSVDVYFLFAAIFSLVFYVLNVFFVDNQLRKLIFQVPGLSTDKTEKISPEQLEWINDKERCSACGTRISVYDLHCPDCGLRLKQSQYVGQPLDVSKYKNTEIKYHFNPKNSGLDNWSDSL